MLLTTDQLTYLRTDLQRLADIKYDPVLNELLDHYATLTEQHMDTGMSFKEASKWAWNDLGQGEGIQKIQDDYIANVQQQIRCRHLTIVKSYFRWPAFLTTALVGVLVYLVVPLIPTDYVIALLYLIVLTPTAILLWLERKLRQEPTSQQALVFENAAKHRNQHVNAVIISSNFLITSIGNESRQTFLQVHSMITVVVCMLLLLYAISFIQLLKERFDFRTTIA
jgi:ABC-type transport system involved in cytochrome c biogenesis permease subunit